MALVTAWRITQARYLDGADASAGRAAFGGEGARRYGGRWNPRGVPVASAAGSRALALLEVLVPLGAPRLPEPHLPIPATFDESLVETLTDLPEGWRAHPAPHATRAVGAGWVEGARSPVLRVPSVIVPAEPNYVFNPRHPAFAEVEIGPPEALDVDARLTGEGSGA